VLYRRVYKVFLTAESALHFYKVGLFKNYTGKKIYVVNDARKRRNTKKAHYKVTKLAFPVNSVKNINGTYVACAELAFFHLATRFSVQALVLIGLEMCGIKKKYVSQKDKPLKYKLTTTKKLSAYIETMHGHNGYQNAARAMKYIISNSSSMAECCLYLHLCLPNYLGGYNIKRPILDRKISVQVQDIHKSIKCNFFWDVDMSEHLIDKNYPVHRGLVAKYYSYKNMKLAFTDMFLFESRKFDMCPIFLEDLINYKKINFIANCILRILRQYNSAKPQNFYSSQSIILEMITKYLKQEYPF
jgi:hypothetical protein